MSEVGAQLQAEPGRTHSLTARQLVAKRLRGEERADYHPHAGPLFICHLLEGGGGYGQLGGSIFQNLSLQCVVVAKSQKKLN